MDSSLAYTAIPCKYTFYYNNILWNDELFQDILYNYTLSNSEKFPPSCNDFCLSKTKLPAMNRCQLSVRPAFAMNSWWEFSKIADACEKDEKQ